MCSACLLFLCRMRPYCLLCYGTAIQELKRCVEAFKTEMESNGRDHEHLALCLVLTEAVLGRAGTERN